MQRVRVSQFGDRQQQRSGNVGARLPGSGESPGHGRDHGEVEHGFVVVGSGFVVARSGAAC